MLMFKCNLCGKAIPRKSVMRLEHESTYSMVDLCEDCGAPIISFLKEHKLLNEWDGNKLLQKKFVNEGVGVE